MGEQTVYKINKGYHGIICLADLALQLKYGVHRKQILFKQLVLKVQIDPYFISLADIQRLLQIPEAVDHLGAGNGHPRPQNIQQLLSTENLAQPQNGHILLRFKQERFPASYIAAIVRIFPAYNSGAHTVLPGCLHSG